MRTSKIVFDDVSNDVRRNFDIRLFRSWMRVQDINIIQTGGCGAKADAV